MVIANLTLALTLWKIQIGGGLLMETTAINLNEEELMRLEGIFMDKNKEEALRFLLEVIKPKLRAKGNRSLDLKKGTGMPR
jgi:hypothetical protein